MSARETKPLILRATGDAARFVARSMAMGVLAVEAAYARALERLADAVDLGLFCGAAYWRAYAHALACAVGGW